MSHPTVARLCRSSSFLSASIRAEGLAAVAAAALLAFTGGAAIPSTPAIATPTPSTTAPSAETLAPATKAERQREYGRLRLHFEPNRGQSAEAARFLARGPGYALFLTEQELVLSLRRGAAEETTGPPDPAFVGPPEPPTRTAALLRLGFVGANPAPVIEGVEPLGGHSNYLLGNDPEQWRAGIPHYGRVRVKDLYPGIDLVLYGNPQQLEYDFVVAPGADPAQIRLSLSGAEAVRLDAAGDLVLDFPGGALRQRAPTVYQDQGGVRRLVEGGYRLLPKSEEQAGAGPELGFAPESPLTIGFQVAAYNPDAALVIDPELVYSTYLGGGLDQYGLDIAVDGTGNAYMTGRTESTYFPTADALYPDYNGGYLSDAFVTKLNAAGTALVYSTYLGGTDDDIGHGIAVDTAGNAYVFGQTVSPDFPTANALDPNHNGGITDAFVTKLNAAGTALVYSTYLGGSEQESASGIAVDGAGNAYVTGETESSDFPTANALHPDHNGEEDYGYDAYVAKLNAAGTALVYSTYLGGTSLDWSSDIAVDGAGNAYVTGVTESSDFPTANALYSDFGGYSDAFVSKLNAAGTALVYSTYLGGTDREFGSGIAVDRAGNAYVTGYTTSLDFPTANAFDPEIGGDSDAYVAKLNAAGTGLVYSTYLGGTDYEWGGDIAVDTAGNAYVTGETGSLDYPTSNALYPSFGGAYFDAFVTKLNSAGAALVYSTYVGGSGQDSGAGIAVDGVANAYVTGYTRSADFPTANPLYPTRSGGHSDAFALRIASDDATAIGVYRPGNGNFYLDTNRSRAWEDNSDVVILFGEPGDLPLAGDWNGDGFDEIGVWRPATRRFLLDTNGNGTWDEGIDRVAPFGLSTDLPVIGDWDGDGIDEIGTWRPSEHRFFLDTNGNYTWDAGTDIIASFGYSTDLLPIAGDWNGDGTDEIGVWRPATRRFFLDINGNDAWDIGTDLVAPFGLSTDLPVIGDWNGDGVDEIGIWRPSEHSFFLDTNGNNTWDVGTDLIANFGASTDLPVTGRW